MTIHESDVLPLTARCHHYTQLDEVPAHIQKYWKGRSKIFRRYNDGFQLTDDAWFGVTPEAVAQRIATDLPVHLPVPDDADADSTVIDLFAGAGGNTIAFALSGRWTRVIGIERDADTLACAQHNAAVAGVPDGAITWVHGDCFDVVARLKAGEALALFGYDAESGQYDPAILPDDVRSPHLTLHLDTRATVLFASPPWGGVSYTGDAVFDLVTMQPYGLPALHALCHPLPHALYLPRTSDLQQLADVYGRSRRSRGKALADKDRLRVVQYCMHGFSKALVAYYPGEADAA